MVEQIDSTIKLTFRQKVFLGKLLDVYREMRQDAIHYSVVAERLGLSNSTAYDMLRVLAQKGMVGSQYTTPKEVLGPGRSSILFYPTAQAKKFFSDLTEGVSDRDEWEDVKAHILANLRKEKSAAKYTGLIRELLNNAPEVQSPLVQCAEIVTALLLSLREAKYEMTEQSSVGAIMKAPVSRLRMSILAGLILGLSLADQRHKLQHVLDNYGEYTEKYEAALQKLNKEALVTLHRFIRDVWDILKIAPQE